MFNNKFPVFALLAATLIAASPSPSHARSAAEIEKLIQDKLAERHPKNDTPEWWRSLGPETPGVLLSLYPRTPQIAYRLKLLGAMAWFAEDPSIIAFLKGSAESPDSASVVRNSALRSVGAGTGASESEFLSKFLRHEDPQTRLAAAEALKRASAADGPGAARAKRELDDYLKSEKASWIVARLEDEKSRHAPLDPVATSEDRPNALFEGEWRGYWIRPDANPAGGLVSEAAILRVKKEGAVALSAELVLESRERRAASLPEAFRAGRVQAKGSKMSGSLPTQLGLRKPTDRRAVEPYGFQAELWQGGAGETLLNLQVPRLGASLVLRRAAR